MLSVRMLPLKCLHKPFSQPFEMHQWFPTSTVCNANQIPLHSKPIINHALHQWDYRYSTLCHIELLTIRR